VGSTVRQRNHRRWFVFEKDATGKQECIRYVDSDYARDLDKCRSITEYVFTLCLAPISWRSTLQYTVTLATTREKYMAMTGGYKGAIWLQGLLDDLGIDPDLLKINCDGISAIYLAKNQAYHARTKHIDVRVHSVREILDKVTSNYRRLTQKRIPQICLSRLLRE